jgi:tetratricopeptide (TPR) repeat protein
LKRFKWILISLLLVELCAAVVLSVMWFREPVPPDPDLSHLHPVTQSELAELRRAVIHDGSADHWQTLGEAYLIFGRFAEAEICCEQAATLSPDSYRAFYWWGLSLNQQGKISEAINRFQQAAVLANDQSRSSSDFSLCWYAIGRNRLREENVAEAEAAFRKAGNFIPARHQLIRIFLRSKRPQKALALLEPSIAAYPNEQTFYQLRAEAWDQLGKPGKAFEDRLRVERCLEQLPSDVLIGKLQLEVKRFGLPRKIEECRTLVEVGKVNEAVNRLRPLLDAQWRPEIAMELAKAELQIGNAQQAVDLLTEIVKSWRSSADILDQLAYGYILLDKHKLATEIAERAAATQPLESVHRNLAAYYKDAKDTALMEKNQALSLYARGREAFHENRIADAQRDFNSATTLQSNFAHAWYYLGECRLARGQSEQAAVAFHGCLKANPNHGRALRRLAMSSIQNAPPEKTATQK